MPSSSSSLLIIPTNSANPSFFLFPFKSPLFLSTRQSHLSFSSLSLSKQHFSLSPLSYSSSFPFHYFQQHSQKQKHPQEQEQEQEQIYSQKQEQEEQVPIGDCLVFEDGVFEDPCLQCTTLETPKSNDPIHRHPTRRKKPKPVKVENLIPEEWKQVQEELNMTNKQKRAIAQQLQYGRRVERKPNPVPLPTIADYTAYREFKMAELNPLVLDNPRASPSEEEASGSDRDAGELEEAGAQLGNSSSNRVEPRNPRLRVGNGSLDDISEFFNSSKYVPGSGESDSSSKGRRKLFTKEEKVLLNKHIPNLADATSDKWLPLHTLVASGEFYLVDLLLKHNVNINATDKDGFTALHRAIICKKQAITNYLLRESANPFVRDKEGATLMHYAVQVASTPAIKILLLYNVDINLPDDDGWTPLHLAVQTQRTDVVRLLLIKGADKTLRNQDGLTPLDLCLYSGRGVRTFELIKLLKELPKSQATLRTSPVSV